jgi:hypothetical protein
MTIQDTATRVFDATIGAGDLAVEKAKSFAGNLREFDARDFWTKRQKRMTKNFKGLAVRGARLRKNVTQSGPAKRAAAQTTQAKRQVKATATSIRKAVGADAQATKSAVKQVG